MKGLQSVSEEGATLLQAASFVHDERCSHSILLLHLETHSVGSGPRLSPPAGFDATTF